MGAGGLWGVVGVVGIVRLVPDHLAIPPDSSTASFCFEQSLGEGGILLLLTQPGERFVGRGRPERPGSELHGVSEHLSTLAVRFGARAGRETRSALGWGSGGPAVTDISCSAPLAASSQVRGNGQARIGRCGVVWLGEGLGYVLVDSGARQLSVGVLLSWCVLQWRIERPGGGFCGQELGLLHERPLVEAAGLVVFLVEAGALIATAGRSVNFHERRCA
ncbi:hypothetical protein RQP46_004375 [Phenoliferia psychrophenolica]